ncbi:MAG: site-specific integrase [Gemmatimonadales bacterium]|nr:site-specific integrase [Gemmatimonadales bacterium]
MSRKRGQREAPGPHIWWRVQKSGPPRAYGDFRPIGGKEPLKAEGERFATTDPMLAQVLFGERLKAIRAGVATSPRARPRGELAKLAAQYVLTRRSGSRATAAWLDQTETFLGRAVEYFGADRSPASIEPDHVAAWVVHMRSEDSVRGRRYSEETIRKHLHGLSGFYRLAQRRKWVPMGYNPVGLLEDYERPGRDPSPDNWLEVHEAAALLEAARSYRAGKHEPRMALAYPIIATFLLTGGRADEVLGLDLNDLHFARKQVHFHANQWRRGKGGKTAGAARYVPMWPQLEAILREYLEGQHLELRLRFDTTMLFPSPETGGRIVDLRKLVDPIARRAGLPEGKYRATAFRKTFATAALQVLDNGVPIAPRTVQGWLGHKSGQMLEAVYGRLGAVRHRSAVVEYRLESSAESSEAHGISHPLSHANATDSATLRE